MSKSPRPERVLVVRLSSLGDVLLATPLVRALAEQRPGGEVDFLTRAFSAPALAGNPHLARLHLLEPGGEARARRTLAARRYDRVLDLSGTLRSRLLVLSLGRPSRTVAKHSVTRRLMVRIPSWRRRALPHAVDRYFATARGLVEPPDDLRPEIHLSPSEREAAARWLGPGPPAVALLPGARWATKAWPAERYRELAERLAREACVRALLFVGPGEGRLAAALGGESGAAGRGAGVGVHRLPFRAVAGVLEQALAAVANDSAMMHLAVAVRTPLVALFGPTVTGFGFSPLGSGSSVIERDLSCRPCSIHGGERCPLDHHECLRGIPVEEVFALVIDKIQRSTRALTGGA